MKREERSLYRFDASEYRSKRLGPRVQVAFGPVELGAIANGKPQALAELRRVLADFDLSDTLGMVRVVGDTERNDLCKHPDHAVRFARGRVECIACGSDLTEVADSTEVAV